MHETVSLPARARSGHEQHDLPRRFTPKRLLGAGSTGCVFEARDESLGRDVAVKLLAKERHHDARSRARFLREARTIAALQHVNIVAVHELDPRGRYIAMELVRGETLKERIVRSGRLPVAEVRRIGAALLAALAAAHDAGVVHRDVKPANVLLGDDGAIKLADFGVAATGDSDLTETGELIGTPAYMAPEQLRGGRIDPTVDLYAVGSTLYEAATGRKLQVDLGPGGDPKRTIRAAIRDRGLADALVRAVRDRPTARYPDARAFAAELARPRRPRIGIAVAILAAAALVFVVTRGERTDELAAGRRALERDDLAAAEKHLAAATDSPDAHYERAIVGWWRARPTPEVIGELDRAIAGGLDPRKAAIARALRSLVALELPAAIAAFADVVAQYPADRDALYGLYEALFHAGRTDDALDIYRRLRTVAPDFALGRHHALVAYLARGDLAHARWVLAGATGAERVRWQAWIDATAGDTERAVREVAAARAEGDADELGWDLVALEARAGQLDRAHALAVELAERGLQAGALPLLGLALARGIATPRDWTVALDAARLPRTIRESTRDAWLDLASLIAITGDSARAQTVLAALPATEAKTMLELGLARALLAGVTQDRDALAEIADSPFSIVRAAAQAELAELDGARDIAAGAWQKVLDLDGFGRTRIAVLVHLARARAELGDAAGSAQSCAAAIAPSLFHWSWAAALGACSELSASRSRP